jgi:amino acid adenylation domain-containing protein
MALDELRGTVAVVGMAGRFSDFDRFDAGFFGFNPREAEILDPQQRVFLEVCWEALEDAGYDPDVVGMTGVFAGQPVSSYLLFNLLPALTETLAGMDPLQLLVGNAADSLATRVSYKLNLKGPSFTVQAGESTPGLAVHLARQSLLNGECDLALAGWVSIDARTLEGEAAVLVLKRAEEALRDRDNVQALVLDSTAIHPDVRLVLEEAPKIPAVSAMGSNRERYVLPVSARSEEALERACQRLADWLEARPELDLADVEHTLTVGRRRFEYVRVVEVLRTLTPGPSPSRTPGPPGEGSKARRVSLPTYPFERRRYWIEPGIESGIEPAHTPAEILDGRHPRPKLFTPYAPPRDEREARVCRIWREVLGVDPVGVHDDFFQLGGHSLLAPQVLGRVREVFAVDFPLQHLFSFPTPAELAEAIGFLAAEAAPSIPPSPLRAAGGPYPLSFSQERLWFIDRLDPGNPIYNEPRAAHISGDLDVAALERSLRELVRRQEALRTTFLEVDGEPAQVIHPVALELPWIDLSALPEAPRRAEAGRLTRAEARRPFDLAKGPVLRTALLILGTREQVVLFNVHHIASDGWSLDLLVEEVATLYRAFSQGLPSPLPEPPVQYADFAHWQRQWLQGETLAAQLAYWREELAGAAGVSGGLELPADRPRQAVQSFRGAVASLELPAGLVEGLDELGRREGATRFMTLLAGFQALLHRLSGQPDVLVGSPIANRTRPEIEGLVGFFVNLLVLRGRFSKEMGFRGLLAQARDTALRAWAHQDLPFEKLVEELRPERDLSRTPVFQVLFVLQNAPLNQVGLPGLTLAARPVEAGVARFDLTLALSETAETAETGVLRLEHNTDLFDTPTASRFLGMLRELLAAAVAEPERPLRDLPLLAAADRWQILSEWNDTRHEPPAVAEATVLESFHRWAERTPNAPALLYGEAKVTYAELAERARRLACHLRTLGVGPERLSAITALCAERSPEMIVGVLGTLEAGGAYLPLDPDYPADRLSFLLADSGAGVLLTTGALAGRIAPLAAAGTLVVLLDEELPEAAIRLPAPDPGRLAYIIYTSGSTGRPKGVLVEHRGLPSLVASSLRWLDVRPGDRILQFASLSFDVSVWETWQALATGATLVLAPREELFPGPGLIELLRRQEVTHLFMPPSALAALPVSTLPLLRAVCVAGEACPPELAKRWGAGRRFVNAYGPTEITVIATLEVASKAKLTIGRPLLDVQAYVLDPDLQPVPLGVPGELCIGGAGVTRGYHNRPELTAERFVPDSFSPEPGSRLYRTGDLTRFLPDGRVEYLGRIDRQVKVRGFRIELGEIEAALARHPAVVEARAVVREEEPGDKRLVAFVVPRAGDPVAELRAALRGTLPEYMVPSRFVLVPSLPMTPSGKVDVARLSAMSKMEIRTEGAPPKATPQGELEGLIAAAWCEVLKVDRVERDDNFFDLGGHSLLLPKLHGRLRETLRESLGRDLTLVDLFRHPTVRSLASFLSPPTAPTPKAVPSTRLRAGWTDGRIAIVGLSCRFPGARDAGELWRNLRDGVESIRRLNVGDLAALGADPALLEDQGWVPVVAMPDDFDRFDARFFGMSVRDAEILDPQQRMFLEASWAALEDAGCDPDSTDARVGVFAGAGVSVYLMRNLLSQAEARSLDPLQTMIANMPDTLTARVSYKLNLRGPSYSVQSACSTSLVAVHHARLSLLAGDCDVALAGGVSLPLTQLAGYRYQEGSIASPDGHCRAFDAGARGTVFGGGAGVVVLKRLEDALADGDTVRAVLLGSAVNNDGALKVGFTAPSAAGQEEVLREALAAAGVAPESIGYVEAHGTGTEVGDPIEVQALSRALAGARRVALGSIKTNFGHLDAAAGVAGLIKTVLALEHRQIPPSLHYETPNPAIDFAGSPVYVNRTLAEWRSDGPRRAGVSSFGIGGTNAHAVLEEAPAAKTFLSSRPWHLLVLSARTEAALEAATQNLAEHFRGLRGLRSQPDHNLADVAWTLQTGRKAFRHRRAVVCRETHDAAEALESLDPARVWTGEAGEERTVAFLLSGQGSQYPGMGREIYDTEPVFRNEIDRCSEIVGIDLRLGEGLERTGTAQPALFAFEYALAALLKDWGIVPDALLGHSLGEYVAACLAGAMTLEDALALVAARGRLMGGLPPGAMLAVALPERETLALLAEDLSLAAVNLVGDPSRCVVSGPIPSIEALERRLAADGVSARRLHTSHAFHSSMMEPILGAFEAEVRKARLSPPVLPWVSNVTGTWITAAEATDPGYWVRHLRQPVRFADGVAELFPGRALLEVGPGTALATLARRQGAEALASTRHPNAAESDMAVLLSAVGRLWAGGQTIDWRRVHGEERRCRVPLPAYPFERERYWIEALGPHPPAPSPASPPPSPGEGETYGGRGGRWLPLPRHGGEGWGEGERDQTRAQIAAIWQNLLGVRSVGPRDDFFELGGDSLVGIQLTAALRRTFGVDLPLRAIFEVPRLADMAARVEALLGTGDETLSIVPTGADRGPLSYSQERLWFLDRLEPDSPLYNVPMALRLTGRLDPATLERSLAEVVRRHGALRTTFEEEAGEPVQVVAPAMDFRLPVVDLRGLPIEPREAEAGRLAVEEARRPFDLRRGPLLRARLLRLETGAWTLLLNLHHVVSDGWSMGVLVEESAALYAAFADGHPSPLAGLPVQYLDFSVWQRRWLRGSALDGLLAWWREALAGAPTLLELPADRPRPAIQSWAGDSEPVALPAGLPAALGGLVREEGATLFMGLLAAFQALLFRYIGRGGQDDILVGTPVANRGRAEVEGLIGFFVNTLVLRGRPAGGLSFRELLGQARSASLDAFAHQDVPFEKLVEALGVERSLAHSPLFQVALVLQNTPSKPVDLPGVSFARADLRTGLAMFDLTLGLWEVEGGIEGTLDYSTALFDASTARRLIGHLRVLLEAAAADPSVPIGELPLLTINEREQLRSWSAVVSEPGGEGLLHELFAAQAGRAPDAVAVVFESVSLTYGELDRRAAALARRLRALGVGPEVPVGLCLERSAEMVVAVLGTLMAGGAYVPLDPAYPEERLRYLFEDSRMPVLVTTRGLGEAFTGLRKVFLEDLETDAGRAPDRHGLTPDHPAYVIYTSGSTGRPKGVVVTHRDVVRLFQATDGWFGFGPGDVWSLFHSYAFDFSVWEIWGTLLYGGRLVVVPYWVSRSPEDFYRLLCRERVTVLNQTPSAFGQLIQAEEALGTSPELPELSLRTVVFGGEALNLQSVAPWWRRHPEGAEDSPRLVNMYGITETTVHVTYRPLSPSDLEGAPGSWIGRAIPDLSVHVLGPGFQPLPAGVPGELHVGGAGLARGYLSRPDLTAERFVPDPFAGRSGARLYRSGDLARWRSSGELEYLGRIDHQVKIRGFRIELGEIEAALARHPAVREAVVLKGGGERLLACLVIREEVGTTELRRFLGERLPEHMVPSGWVLLDAFPLTTNGKVDRRALAGMEPRGGEREVQEGPRTLAEERLAAIWSDLLGVAGVGVRDDFFELGGHSLLATRVVSRVRETFGVELPLRALFESPALADLAARIEEAGRAAEPPIVRVEMDAGREKPPLSFGQERLWFLDRLEPGSTAYNIPFALRLRGELNVEALERSLREVVRRHGTLRTTFAESGGVPFQVIDPETRFELETAGGAPRPFDLARGPLFRAVLTRISEDDWRLFVDMHHIVSDGWSMGILVRECAALYETFSQGRPSPLVEPPVQYADFAVWQRQRLQGEVLEAHVRRWREALEGAPALLELPTDRPRPAVQSYRGASEPVAVRMATIRELAGREGATPFMVVLAAFEELLRRWSGQEDVLVGTPIANRTRAEVEDLIGLFVNTLVMRRPKGPATFRELLAGVRSGALAAYTHQDLPFEKLVEELGVERSLAHSPLFQVMLVLQNAPVTALSLAGLELSPVTVAADTVKLDLLLSLSEDGDGSLDFATDLFDRATAVRMLGNLRMLLEAATAEPGARLADLPLLTEAERAELAAWNRTVFEYPDVCLHELIEAQVERTPNAVAVVFEGESLTYRELDERASALASRLPATLIGICAERSLEMVVGLVAILKVGGAYVPLDPSYPAERLAYMIEDSGVSVLLTREDIAAGVGARFIAPRIGPDSLAYMIYTSGSTGRPKGALNSHRGIVNRLLWMQQEYGLTPEDRVLQKTPFSFDVSVWELFWPLIVGARLVVARPGGHQDPAYLVETIRREAITTLHFVPSMLQVFVEQPGVERCASLRKVMASGEALPADLAKRFFTRLPQGVELHNLYGPTEAAVDVTYHACHPGEERVPIGRPVANTRIHILDPDGAQVPVGVAGELFIAGMQVGRGYLHRPDLTAERFMPDENGARMYRTGDLARWLSNGEVEYLGRIDHQVKIRGFRIELGEIEARLCAHPEVREAVVLVREQSLVACVAPPAEADLRSFLRESLPEHMVPSAFVFLESMPVTPNGKADRKALALVEPDRRERAFTAPRTATEEILAGIWRDLLGVESVGVEDGFFDLGGHSLMAARLVSRIRDAFGVELPLRAVFEAPAMGDLAARIESESGAHPAAPPLRRASHDDPPLSFSQERLWFLDQLEPGSPLYNIPAALRLSGGLDVRALERSFQEVVRRHESLRTTFPARDGKPVQRVAPALDLAVPEVDLSALPEETRETELRRIAAAEAARPFDLWNGPLLRVLTLRLAATEHACVLTLHHIVGDAWSFDVLVRELGILYAADAADAAGEPLPEPALQYADFAAWQRGWLRGEVLEAELAWWRQELAGAPTVLDLPSDRPRPAARTARGESVPLSLDISDRLHAACRREGATPFMLLLAAFQALLHRMTGVDDLLAGTPVAGRSRTELEGLIGFFVNTLPLRGRPTGPTMFRERLAEARATALGAFAHPDIPLERLIEDLGVQRSLAHPPLVQVAFALQNAPAGALELPGLTVEPIDLTGSTAKFDLTLYLFEEGSRLRGGLEYSSDLFDRSTMIRFADGFGVLLEAALGDPEIRLDDLPVMEEGARHQVLAEWNDYRRILPEQRPERGVPELFEEQATLRPDAMAAVFGDERLTYGELDRRANRLANFLRRLGAGLGTPVAIYLERSLEMVVSTLAVLKAGGAYVPLDTSYPEERLAFMLADVGAPVLIAREEHLGLFAKAPVEMVCVDRYAPVLARMSDQRPRLEIPSHAPAYVIYTSGSTGRPKGVAVPHRAVVRLVRESDYVVLGPDDVVAQASNTSFDAATFEIWGALLNGGRLVGVSKETMLSPAGLAAQIRRDGIGVLFLTTALFNQISHEAPEAFAPLKTLLFGGELVDPARVRSVLVSGAPERLLHVYGPTESTTFASWHLVGSVPEDAVTVPIGRPLSNTALLVLDPGLCPVPPGWTGELYVGGDGLAWGYANRPELTAERFVPDPFAAAGRPGERLYRTGDLVRRRADGAIEFLGRADFQVKIRGFRIELGEVQSALVALPEVLDAAVLVLGDAADRRLVAYVSPRPGESLRETSTRAALADRLPSFMVPSAIVVLESLPLNPNGKVDRKALARIEPAAAGERAGFVAPRTPAEEMLAGIWSDLLGAARVGSEDVFFDLGGHSLLATRLVSLVRERFGVELPLRTVFEAPSLAGMARAIEQARAGDEAPPVLPLSEMERGGRPPLSFAQERLWFLDRMEPGRAFYNVPGAVRLRGVLDLSALGRAVDGIARRHEAVRTTFDQLDGVPFQVVASELRLAIPVVDLMALTAIEREAEILRRLRAEAARPFDLSRGPLLRVLLLRLGTGEWALLFNFHHIVCDGWSIDVFVRELAALYGGLRLPALPVQYADYAVWQRRWLTDEVLASQIAYWKEALAGAPTVLELPTDRPRPAVQTFRGATRPLAFSSGLSGELRALSRRQGGTLFMTLLAGYQALLHRYSGQGEVLVGSPIANRGRREIEGLIGLFVNAVALRGQMSDGPSFRELIGRVRTAALGAYAHQDLPFERLVEELQIERNLGRTPLYQAVFAFQRALQSSHRAASGETEMPGLAVEPLAIDTGTGGTAKLDLLLSLTDSEAGLAGGWEHSTDLFDSTTIDRFSGHLARLLAAAAADPERSVAELPLLAVEESFQLLSEWNDTRRPCPEACLHDLLRAPVERTPDAVAVRFEGGSLTYRDLDARGERLARRLRALGVGPERLVGICAGEGIERLVAVVAVFKAGGAYLPLDPAHPAERLAFMMEDAGIAVLLAEDRLLPLLPETRASLVRLGDDGDAAGAPIESGVLPDNLAYVIYTSGSTGRPNGVMVRHRSAVNLILHAVRQFRVEPGSRVLQSVSFSFDASVLETWMALASGATLCIGTRESRMSGEALAGLVRGEEITHAVLTPSTLAMLPADGLPTLRVASVGGDRCPPELASRWAPPASGLDALMNCYGPTETAIYAVAGPCRGPYRREPAIGRPVANLRACVLDARGQLVPVGVPGELFLGGEGLARGYLARPALTAERFVPDPFGERLYRTGDLVRWLPEGDLEFLGRVDGQVKIRGLRIETGEVEAALGSHEAVAECAVVVRENPGGDPVLLACVVPRRTAGGADLVKELRDHLRSRLPDYMVPGSLLFLESMPLSPTGKMDRAALRRLDLEDAGSEWVEPRDVIELELARLWQEVLGVPRLGVRDNFFALGGHSLLAVRLLARVQERFDRELPLAVLFQEGTVEEMAARLRRDEIEGPASCLVPIQPSGPALPFFCVHPAGGDVLCYAALARHLGAGQPFYGLQSRGLSDDEPPLESVPEIAALYVEEIRRVQPAGPYRLGGWSLGGLIAFEMARQLAEAGEEVALLAMIDSSPGITGGDLPDDVALLLDVVAYVANLWGKPDLSVPREDLEALAPEARLDFVLDLLREADFLPPGTGRDRLRRVLDVYRANGLAVHSYEPGLYPGPLTLFKAADGPIDDPFGRALGWALGWEDLAAGPVEIETVPGHHLSLLAEPNVRTLARRLRQSLEGAVLEETTSCG